MSEEIGGKNLPAPPYPEIRVAQLTEYATRLVISLGGAPWWNVSVKVEEGDRKI